MTIRNLFDEDHRKLGQAIRYKGVELQEAVHTLYDEDPTPFQRQIEMSVTNGKGYLSIQDSLEIVNKNSPQMNLYDALDTGLIPLYFKEPLIPRINSTNPCSEIPFGESFEVTPPIYHPIKRTLLEQLRTQQKIKGQEEIRRQYPYVLFRAA